MTSEARNPGCSEPWLEVAAAVEYLDATHRPGLTVWDALAEAVRWWVEEARSPEHFGHDARNLPWHDPDPLRSALESLLTVAGPAGSLDGADLRDVMDGALCNWLDVMASTFNDDRRFATSWPARRV